MVRIGRRHIVQFGAIVSGAVSLLLSLFLSFVIAVVVAVLKIVFHFSLRFLSLMVMVIVGGRCDSGGSIGGGHESRTCW